MKSMTTKEIIFDSKNLPVNIDEAEWVLMGDFHETFKEAQSILESVGASGGFSIPFRAREWLKKYVNEL